MDKTYAAEMGEKPFDWNKVLAEPPPQEGDARYSQLSDLAFSWVTCACGNQCAIIPRTRDCERFPEGQPEDAELAELGGDFSCHIDALDWPAARATLAAIEARSAVLIEQELAKLNAP